MDEKQKAYKDQHDKNAKSHKFSIGQKVWYLETNFLGELSDAPFLEIGQADGILGQDLASGNGDKPNLQPKGIGRFTEVAEELSHFENGNLNLLTPIVVLPNFPLTDLEIVTEVKRNLWQENSLLRTSAKDLELS